MLDRSRLLGRYCGLQRDGSAFNIPQRFVSIHREIILDFFSTPSTMKIRGVEEFGFNGTFRMVSDGASPISPLLNGNE